MCMCVPSAREDGAGRSGSHWNEREKKDREREREGERMIESDRRGLATEIAKLPSAVNTTIRRRINRPFIQFPRDLPGISKRFLSCAAEFLFVALITHSRSARAHKHMLFIYVQTLYSYTAAGVPH